MSAVFSHGRLRLYLLKLLADGKYVFRHYIGSLGVMSLGTCR